MLNSQYLKLHIKQVFNFLWLFLTGNIFYPEHKSVRNSICTKGLHVVYDNFDF